MALSKRDRAPNGMHCRTEYTELTPRRIMGESLHIRQLSKSFEHNGAKARVLSSVDLSTRAGEFQVLLGPSGCGKSTMLKIIAGLDRPDDNPLTEILLGGNPISGPGPDRGIVFQSYSSFPWLTARQNVEFALRRFRLGRRERKRQAMTYLDLVRLADYADFYPKMLSGGQQQRVAIARTLAMQPNVLLMDEPYAALDAQNRELQQAELLRIWSETRPTVLFVTHDISEAAFLGQRVIVLSNQPSRVLATFDTSEEVDCRIIRRLRASDTDHDLELAHRLSTSLDNGQFTSRLGELGQWLRTQPEFYDLMFRLKGMLPAPVESHNRRER